MCGAAKESTRSSCILVVEDEAAQRAMLRELFEGEGFAVVEARDGKEGLNKVAETGCRHLALIIVDLIMPRVGGLAFIRKLREQHEADCPPLLVCTGQRERKIVELAMQREVDGYVLKPYKVETMLERARLLMGQRGKSRGAT